VLPRPHYRGVLNNGFLYRARAQRLPSSLSTAPPPYRGLLQRVRLHRFPPRLCPAMAFYSVSASASAVIARTQPAPLTPLSCLSRAPTSAGRAAFSCTRHAGGARAPLLTVGSHLEA
jgi:hypothetical protein